jgi:GTP-binding protein
MAIPGIALQEQLPVVVIVGRANVGKSTLFNALIEENKALVSDIAGTTRTNNEGNILWCGQYVRLIDTGGIDSVENELFAKEIMQQSRKALEHADIILFVIDAETGVLPQDKELARMVVQSYRKKAQIFLVANKADSKKIEQNFLASSWPSLALGEAHLISAATGRGVGDVLDHIYEAIAQHGFTPKHSSLEQVETIHVSLIGKPNVGKSSLFNKLIDEEKVIVSDIAHTTREPFDTTVAYNEGDSKYLITFIDTAGIRRKTKVSGVLERQGISKSIKSIENSDIVLLVLDGSEIISVQDMQLAGLIEKRSKSVVILINKWDLAEDNSDSYRNEVKEMIYSQFPHLDFASILFVSGKSGYRVQQVFPLLAKIAEARKTEVDQRQLDLFIKRATFAHKPARGKGTRQPSISRFHQINVNPPVFEAFIKYRTSLHRSYLQYLERKLREEFNFEGTPIVIKMTKMKRQ